MWPPCRRFICNLGWSVMAGPLFDWDDDAIALLRKLAGQRRSGGYIGAELGITRSAVLGKCSRLGIKLTSIRERRVAARPKQRTRAPSKPKRLPASASGPPIGACAADRPAAGARVEESAGTTPATHFGTDATANLRNRPNQCRWPFGDPKHADFHYCTDDALEAKPYCAVHMKKQTSQYWFNERKQRAASY